MSRRVGGETSVGGPDPWSRSCPLAVPLAVRGADTSLAHLNSVYEAVWPGLRFITFVAGRSRAVIVNEMEEKIGIPTSPQPLPDNFPTREPALGSSTVKQLTREKYGDEWKKECDRALIDVWRIGHARLGNMGLK